MSSAILPLNAQESTPEPLLPTEPPTFTPLPTATTTATFTDLPTLTPTATLTETSTATPTQTETPTSTLAPETTAEASRNLTPTATPLAEATSEATVDPTKPFEVTPDIAAPYPTEPYYGGTTREGSASLQSTPEVYEVRDIASAAQLISLITQANNDPINTYVLYLLPGSYRLPDVNIVGKVVLVGNTAYQPAGCPDKDVVGNVIFYPEDTTRVFSVDTTGTLTLYHAIVRGNGSSSITSGGAIFNRGTLNIYESLFCDNRAIAWGGAIYSQGSLVKMINSVFDANRATGNFSNTGGGALVTQYGGQIDAQCTTFQNNTTASYGGALHLFADAGLTLLYRNGDAALSNNFLNNTAGRGYGAIYNLKTPPPLLDATNQYWNPAPSTTASAVNSVRNTDTANPLTSVVAANCAVPEIPVATAPFAYFTANVTQGIIPLEVSFINYSSTGTYHWDFGDDTNCDNDPADDSGTNRDQYEVSCNVSNPVHVLARKGAITYTVTLTVQNALGQRAYSQNLTVLLPLAPENCATVYSGSNLRTGPGTSYNIIRNRTVPSDILVTPIYFSQEGDGIWYLVEYDRLSELGFGARGWARYDTIGGISTCGSIPEFPLAQKELTPGPNIPTGQNAPTMSGGTSLAPHFGDTWIPFGECPAPTNSIWLSDDNGSRCAYENYAKLYNFLLTDPAYGPLELQEILATSILFELNNQFPSGRLPAFSNLISQQPYGFYLLEAPTRNLAQLCAEARGIDPDQGLYPTYPIECNMQGILRHLAITNPWKLPNDIFDLINFGDRDFEAYSTLYGTEMFSNQDWATGSTMPDPMGGSGRIGRPSQWGNWPGENNVVAGIIAGVKQSPPSQITLVLPVGVFQDGFFVNLGQNLTVSNIFYARNIDDPASCLYSFAITTTRPRLTAPTNCPN